MFISFNPVIKIFNFSNSRNIIITLINDQIFKRLINYNQFIYLYGRTLNRKKPMAIFHVILFLKKRHNDLFQCIKLQISLILSWKFQNLNYILDQFRIFLPGPYALFYIYFFCFCNDRYKNISHYNLMYIVYKQLLQVYDKCNKFLDLK
jgi:hypothetical protein